MIQYTEGKIDKLKITCQRCGIEAVVNARQLYRQTESTKLCRSCTAKPAKTNMRNGWLCFPHRGEIDLNTMTPLDKNGKPYLPGERICGTLDCTTKSHIVSYNTPKPKKPKPKKSKIKTQSAGIFKGQEITFEQFTELELQRKAKS
jgi:hypothetical protein